MGACRENPHHNNGLPFEACGGCRLTTLEGTNLEAKIGGMTVRLNREKFIRECPEQLPNDLEGETRYYACVDRMYRQFLSLSEAEVRINTVRKT